MEENILEQIGLTKWESQTYLALLELGSTTTGPLVKKCEVPQSKIYSVLGALNKKGLASYIIKGKTKYFQASDPDKILSLLKENETRVKSLLSELKAKQHQSKQSVELFEGLKSMRAILLGLIQDVRKGEEWYGFSTGETSKNPEIERFYEWWGSLKIHSGLKDHLLISLSNKSEFEASLSKEAKCVSSHTIKYSKVSFPGDTAIFRDKVILFNWEGPPSATLITSKSLSLQYQSFFLGAWKQAWA